jgi:hypothetical protein
MRTIQSLLVPISLALSLAAPAAAWSQATYPESEYIAGHSGFPDKIKGTLQVSPTGITLVEKDGAVAFTIPMSEITSATQQSDIVSASFGMKLLIGNLAGSRKQEYVQVAMESTDNAEGIVFKVKKGTSLDAVTKINFYVKHLVRSDSTTRPPADSTRTDSTTVASGTH